MFGRLTHLALDLVAISTIFAGIKKSTGFSPRTSLIKEPSVRSFFDNYFAIGDTVFGMMCGFVVNSGWFRKSVK